jgi:hypothetical protein
MKNRLVKIVAVALVVCALAGCRQATRVSYNLSKEADNFNVTRHLMVINTRTDTPLLEIIGNLSVDTSDGDINVIIEVAPGQYKKHFVSMNEYTVYVVEDISGANVTPYHYEVNILPQMFETFTVTFHD